MTYYQFESDILFTRPRHAGGTALFYAWAYEQAAGGVSGRA